MLLHWALIPDSMQICFRRHSIYSHLQLTIYRYAFNEKREGQSERELPCDKARQWLSPMEMSTTLVVASSSISLGLSAVASEEPHPRQAPQPQAYT